MRRRQKTALQEWTGTVLKDLLADSRTMEPTHAGWDRAWEVIRHTFGDFGCECPDTGERWQYMGTARGCHDFRHRCLPPACERVYYRVPVVDGDFQEDNSGPTATSRPFGEVGE